MEAIRKAGIKLHPLNQPLPLHPQLLLCLQLATAVERRKRLRERLREEMWGEVEMTGSISWKLSGKQV
jgi:hypothetical protein